MFVPTANANPMAVPARGAAPIRLPGITPVLVVLPFLVVLVLNIVAAQQLDSTIRILASGICLLGWLPFILHVVQRRSGLPLMPTLGLIYSVYFGWVVFLRDQFVLPGFGYSVPDGLIVEVLTISLLGIGCMIFSYHALPQKALAGLPRIRFTFDAQTGTESAVVAGILALALTRIDLVVDIPARFASLFQLVGQLQMFSIALLFYNQLRHQLRLRDLLWLWIVFVPAHVLASLTSGAVGAVVYDMLVLLGVYWLARRKWPWKTVVLCSLLVIPMLGVKAEYRSIAWSGGQMTVLEKTGLYLRLIGQGMQGFSESFQKSIERIDQMSTFCAVRHLTPETIPYWSGESYATLYWMAIPRFLYPSKPTKTIGQDFGHRYGLLGKTDRNTSYNLPQMVEMYANFGDVGVIVGMFLVGVICRSLHFMFSHASAGEGGALIAVLVFTRLCNIESDFSLVYGGLFLNVIAFVVILRIMQARRIHLPLDALRFR